MPTFHLTIGQLPQQEALAFVSSEPLRLPLVWPCGGLALLACSASGEPLRAVQRLPLAPWPPAAWPDKVGARGYRPRPGAASWRPGEKAV